VPEDSDFVEAAKQGDKAAYGSLVEMHAHTVFGVCLGILCTRQDAEDASQEAFLRGFVQIGALRSGARFRPWIVAITKNVCLDFLRRRERTKRVTTLPVTESDVRVTVAEHGRGDRDEVHERLQRAISTLPEKYRIVLVLYYFDGQRTESVASALNLAPAGVATRLSRARTMLRQAIGEEQL